MQNSNWYTFKFFNGPIPTQAIADSVTKCSSNYGTGAYSIFLGQVREDMIDEKLVDGIDYTANEEMAQNAFSAIINDAQPLYSINTAFIYHSIGTVKKGELCLLVLIACGHRKESFKAVEYVVERLKKEVPVWGKELLADHTHSWKVNK